LVPPQLGGRKRNGQDAVWSAQSDMCLACCRARRPHVCAWQRHQQVRSLQRLESRRCRLPCSRQRPQHCEGEGRRDRLLAHGASWSRGGLHPVGSQDIARACERAWSPWRACRRRGDGLVLSSCIGIPDRVLRSSSWFWIRTHPRTESQPLAHHRCIIRPIYGRRPTRAQFRQQRWGNTQVHYLSPVGVVSFVVGGSKGRNPGGKTSRTFILMRVVVRYV